MEPAVSQNAGGEEGGDKTRTRLDLDNTTCSDVTSDNNRAREDNKLSGSMVGQILNNNPTLTTNAQGVEGAKIGDIVGNMRLDKVLARTPGRKDVGSYKFWNTQPVARFGVGVCLPI